MKPLLLVSLLVGLVSMIYVYITYKFMFSSVKQPLQPSTDNFLSLFAKNLFFAHRVSISFTRLYNIGTEDSSEVNEFCWNSLLHIIHLDINPWQQATIKSQKTLGFYFLQLIEWFCNLSERRRSLHHQVLVNQSLLTGLFALLSEVWRTIITEKPLT